MLELDELYKAAPIYRELFLEQLEFALTPSRYMAAICSRRAGKTTVCAAKAIQELISHPNSMGVYLALTDRSVENIFMPCAHPIINKYKIKCKVNRDEILFPNGSKLLVAGANHIHKIEGFRGLKLLFCIIDEAASFSEKILHYLIDEIIGPSLSDLQGQLILIGTPSPHCSGMFYDVTQGLQKLWAVKRWTAFSNPHMAINFTKTAEEFLERKQCDVTHPKYRREYLGEWAADDESLMYKQPTLQHPPCSYNVSEWRSVVGVDFGFNDKTAFCVIGWQRNNPKSFVLESFGFTGEDLAKINAKIVSQGKEPIGMITYIATTLQRLKEIYKPITFVGDPAGASKIIMQEFRDKYSIFMDSAEKTNKAHYVEILNDALFNQQIVFHPTTTLGLQKELAKIVWNEERTRELDSCKCDEADALLYAYRESLAYTEKIVVKHIKTPKEIEEEMLKQQIAKDLEWEEDSFYSGADNYVN